MTLTRRGRIVAGVLLLLALAGVFLIVCSVPLPSAPDIAPVQCLDAGLPC